MRVTVTRQPLRRYEHAHLLSNIEKPPLPISGSGTKPEFPLGRLHLHVEKDILSLFGASSQSPTSLVVTGSQAEGEGDSWVT